MLRLLVDLVYPHKGCVGWGYAPINCVGWGYTTCIYTTSVRLGIFGSILISCTSLERFLECSTQMYTSMRQHGKQNFRHLASRSRSWRKSKVTNTENVSASYLLNLLSGSKNIFYIRVTLLRQYAERWLKR